jgi:hypothetical protein
MVSSPSGSPGAPSRPLPSYQHPPLVGVRLAVRTQTPRHVAGSILLERLGPTWRAAADAQIVSLLGDQRIDWTVERLSYEWDGTQGEAYPHYETVRDGFVQALVAWRNHAAFDPVEWEVEYRNRIPQGTVWQSPRDWGFCRLLAGTAELPLVEAARDVQAEWTFQQEPGGPTLRCRVWFEPSAPAVWITLTCRGACTAGESTDDAWLGGCDAARRMIVATFRDLMSPAANAYWEPVS